MSLGCGRSAEDSFSFPDVWVCCAGGVETGGLDGGWNGERSSSVSNVKNSSMTAGEDVVLAERAFGKTEYP